VDAETLLAVVEAALATSPGPLSVATLVEGIGAGDVDEARVTAALEELARRHSGSASGLRLERVAGGWRMATAPEVEPYLREIWGRAQRQRLSQAALEVLAVVAYRQPVTLPEINFIRGVNSASAVRTLLDHGLIRVSGRKRVVGRPFLYRTTQEFLVHFGLDSLDELPRPEAAAAELDEALAAGSSEG